MVGRQLRPGRCGRTRRRCCSASASRPCSSTVSAKRVQRSRRTPRAARRTPGARPPGPAAPALRRTRRSPLAMSRLARLPIDAAVFGWSGPRTCMRRGEVLAEQRLGAGEVAAAHAGSGRGRSCWWPSRGAPRRRPPGGCRAPRAPAARPRRSVPDRRSARDSSTSVMATSAWRGPSTWRRIARASRSSGSRLRRLAHLAMQHAEVVEARRQAGVGRDRARGGRWRPPAGAAAAPCRGVPCARRCGRSARTSRSAAPAGRRARAPTRVGAAIEQALHGRLRLVRRRGTDRRPVSRSVSSALIRVALSAS